MSEGWRKPPGLGLAGHELWELLVSDFTFRPDEAPLVAELCHLADDLALLRAEVSAAPLTVSGSKGQPVAHPLRGELHKTSARFESVVKTLGIPGESGSGISRSWAGRNLARQRWG